MGVGGEGAGWVSLFLGRLGALRFVELFSALYDGEAVGCFPEVDDEGVPFASQMPISTHN